MRNSKSWQNIEWAETNNLSLTWVIFWVWTVSKSPILWLVNSFHILDFILDTFMASWLLSCKLLITWSFDCQVQNWRNPKPYQKFSCEEVEIYSLLGHDGKLLRKKHLKVFQMIFKGGLDIFHYLVTVPPLHSLLTKRLSANRMEIMCYVIPSHSLGMSSPLYVGVLRVEAPWTFLKTIWKAP